MTSKDVSANREPLARIRQLEEETARLQVLVAELVLKNHQLRREIARLECEATGSVTGNHHDRRFGILSMRP
jgi:hypothetical protein